MCDERSEKEIEELGKEGGQLNRRDFTKMSTAAIAAMMFPDLAMSAEILKESEVSVKMAKGTSDCYYVRPAKGKHPAVLIWPDIFGLRPAFKAMGKRLAAAGYAVLVVNPFYRDAKHPVVALDTDYRKHPDTFPRLRKLAAKLTQDAAMSDARDYIAFLDSQSEVDKTKKVGTAGYCMGGPLIMRTAAAMPKRVGAAASFHGGGLVSDKPDSPHLLIPRSPAHVLHAVAENDDKKKPDAKTVLAKAYKAAKIPAEIEVYKGTLHGWCPPDSPVYNKEQAERAWSRMLALYKKAL